MASTLMRLGLIDRLGAAAEISSHLIEFGQPTTSPGPSGLLAEDALVTMTENLATALDAEHSAHRFPIVIGGDCSVLLGVLKTDLDDPGLLFIDGHEDAWPPAMSPTGETADSELGIALGIHAGPVGSFDHPLIRADRVAVLGPRDAEELDASDVPSIAPRVGMYVGATLPDLDPIQLGRQAGSHLNKEGGGWWLHIDLDVLSTEALAAVDYQQPGGVTWDYLHRLTQGALSSGGCLGVSVVIYNPDLDQGASAGRINDFIAHLVDVALTIVNGESSGGPSVK